MAGLKPSLYALVLQESRRITKAGEHSNPVTRSFYILLWCGIFFVYAGGGWEVGVRETSGDFSGGDFGRLRVRDAVPGETCRRHVRTWWHLSTLHHIAARGVEAWGEWGLASGDVPIRCGRAMARPYHQAYHQAYRQAST